MNKRDVLFSLLETNKPLPYLPAAFFLHFSPEFHTGQAAVDKHLEYFRHTGMDLIKIQFECNFPHLPEIQKPDDWVKMPQYGQPFFEGQLKAVEGLVKAAKSEAVIVMTLYSPFMCAGHTTSQDVLTAQLRTEPEKVKKGLEIITDSLMYFVRECIKLGVDGFYTSTQGSEAGRFDDPSIFRDYIKPFDLELINEANRACPYNILHVCDYQRDYNDFSQVVDYPGQIVNAPLSLGGKHIAPVDAAQLFNRPYMGGLERTGAIYKGNPAEIQKAVIDVLSTAPEKFMLGADCTVPSDVSWDNLKLAIDTAHAYKRS